MADEAPLLSSSPTRVAISDPLETYIGDTTATQILQACFISLAWAFDAQQTFISVFTDSQTSTSTSPQTSVLTDWNLSSTALAGLPASSYFAGCLIGGLCIGTLADTLLGRKKTLSYSCLIMSLSGALSSLSPNIWAYSLLRFLCGFSRASVGGSALVLSTEIVGKRSREQVSIFGFFCFTLGFLSLPIMAYVNEGGSWRNLYLCTSIPSLLYSIILCFWIQESPRWLLVKGRREEAIDCIRKIVSSSNADVVNSSFSKLVDYRVDSEDCSAFVAFKLLYETRWAFRRLTAAMIAGLGIGLVYYGMPLNVGNLGSNLYLSVTFNALAELPSSFLTLFFIGRLNRKMPLLCLTTLSGVFSVACVFVEAPALRMTVEVVSFFAACSAFNILLIYSIELFPTCVRNSAISLLRQAIVLGGVFAPILVVQGRKNSLVSFGVFGLSIFCCGLFVVCLPETRGKSICDTMEEEYKQIEETFDINP